jgi:lipoate-protein ligase A
VTDRALVLGSSQRIEVVDEEWANFSGVAVARRRAGGGAVLVEPGSQLWFDVFVPAGDRLYQQDVGVSFQWLGDIFAHVINSAVGGSGGARSGVGESVTVHKGALVSTDWSRLLCFCGIGPGEVLVGGRKVLGLAQRRNRAGAWLHAMVLCRLDPVAVVDLLRLVGEGRQAAAEALATTAAPVMIPPDDLVEGLFDQLAGVDVSR